jgi:hypothetical protein
MFNLFRVRKEKIEAPKLKPKKLFVIETLSSHLIRYVVECDEDRLQDIIVHHNNLDDLSEFSQEHLGDKIVSYHTIKDQEGVLKMFDADHPAYTSWTPEQKLSRIMRK